MYKKNTAFSCSRNRLVYSKIFRAMKLIVVFILASMLQVSAATYAQINLKTKDAAIEEVFISIRQQSGYDFLYSSDLLKKAKPVSIEVKNASITEAMDKLLENEPFTYIINSKTVTLKSKPYQEIQIRGKVTDQKGEGIQGVSIKIKEGAGGTTSERDGLFSLKVPSPKSVLVFSFLGFVSQEIVVGSSTNFNVTLVEKKQDLNTVVVTALGIKREERSLGYAITKIDSNQLTDAPSGNWLDALSGKVAGLNMVRSNGGPAGSNKIILRGENNLTGDNEALVVIDGVVVSSGSGRRTATGGSAAAPSAADGAIQPTDFGSGLNDLNPEDIESVTVLKGPGASALYGQRGANGAIVITTKSGSANRKLGITVTSNGSLEGANRWPDMQYEYGAGTNGTDTYSYTGANGTSVAWGPRFNGQNFIQYNPVTQSPATEATPWVPYTNQIREFFETGKNFTNSISIDGNIKKNTTFRVSATHGNNHWIIPNTGYGRTSVSLSTNSKITKKLSLAIKANYNERNSDNLPGMGYGNQSVMYWFVFWLPNLDINWLRDYWKIGQEYRALHDIVTTAPENPYAISYEFINASKRRGITGNAQLNYKFNKEFSMQVRATLDRTHDDREVRRPWTAASLPKGTYRTQDILSREYSGDFLLKYDKKVNSDFNITASFGGSMLKNRYYNEELRTRDGLIEPNVYTFENAVNGIQVIPDTSRFSINSIYGLFSASYKNYLYLDITGRNDWSSTLATPYRTDNVGFFYPSASLSFIASDYFKLPKTINYAKLRLSASQVGSGGTIPYRTAYLYGLAANGIYPNGALQNPTTIPNPNLKPLKTTTYEWGGEIKLFKNRLGVDFAYYWGKTNNQILDRIVDRSSGFTRQIINAGQVNNSGVELALNATPVDAARGLKWKTFMTFATNKNKIVSMADTTVLLRAAAVGSAQIVAKVGGSMGDMYGTGFERSPDGQIIYTANGIPRVTASPVYLGNTIPKYKASIGNEFKYRQFRFNILFDAQRGGVAHSYTHARMADFGKLSITLPGRYGGIIGHGVMDDGNGGYVPNTTVATDLTTFYNTMLGTLNAEGATYKTDFIKLREARLDYSLPKSVLKPIRLSRATIGVYGRNLFIWSTWPLFDPEFGTLSGTDIVSGFEVGQFPSTRTYGFNLVIGI